MRLIVSTAVLATFFAVPAHARDGHFYIGGDLGLILAADSDLEFVPGGVAGSTGSADRQCPGSARRSGQLRHHGCGGSA